jgi:predicted permease
MLVNKRIEVLHSVLVTLGGFVYFIVPAVAFNVVDPSGNLASGFLVGIAWTCLFIGIFAWFLSGEVEDEEEEQEVKDAE